jgi:hypothetical protein
MNDAVPYKVSLGISALPEAILTDFMTIPRPSENEKEKHGLCFAPGCLTDDVDYMRDLLRENDDTLISIMSDFAIEYAISRRSHPIYVLMLPPQDISAVCSFLNDAVPALMTITEGYLALTDFIAALCPVSPEFSHYLSEINFLETFLLDTLQAGHSQACHNLLRIARHIWSYESSLGGLDARQTLALLRGIPIQTKDQAAAILYIIRDLVCCPSDLEDFISMMFSLMADILGRFHSRRISKRVCTTTLVTIARYSISISEIEVQPFFGILMDRFIKALNFPPEKFPRQFFSLLLRLVRSMDFPRAVQLLQSASVCCYWHIFLCGTADAAGTCLQFVCYFCRRDPDIAVMFADAPFRTLLIWDCAADTCTAERKLVWMRLCHALIVSFGPAIVPKLVLRKAMRIAAKFIKSGAPDLYCVHLMSVIFRATARWEDALQFFEALGKPWHLLEELSELTDCEANPGLIHVLSFSGQRVDLREEAATIMKFVLEKLSELTKSESDSDQSDHPTVVECDTLA